MLARYRDGMVKNMIRTAAAAGMMIALAAGSAYAFQGQELAPQAKVSLKEARAIALRTLPGGTIVDQELEKEKGGTGLRYSFDVKVKGKVHEVGIDAKTGKVLENNVEGAHPD